MPHIALTKQLILQHRAERRRDRDGKLKRHMLINQALHHAHQWDVALGHRLEEPVLFEEMLMFRMTNEWKMRVKNERKRTGRHFELRSADCGLIPLSARLEIRNPQSPIRDCYSVRQKSWKRSRPFLITSILVA